MSEKRLSDKEKQDTEKVIEFKLGQKSTILLDPKVSDENFFDALRDVCALNLLRDEINK